MNLDSFPTLRLWRRGRILNVQFNRAATLNAIDAQGHDDIVRCFSEMANDPKPMW